MLKFVVFVMLVAISYGQLHQNLDTGWILRNANRSIELEVCTPLGIYSNLMQSNLIENIFYRFNDINYRWVSIDNWTYSLQFQVKPILFMSDFVKLVLEGVDTFSNVFLNDIELMQTNNMFLKYEIDVKKILKPHTNNLIVEFQSAVFKAKESRDNFLKNYGYTIPPECVPNEYNGECHVNYIRKMQASFGWDWGPAFPSIGLWKPVYLLAYNLSRVVDITTTTFLNEMKNIWIVNVTSYFSEKVPRQRFIINISLDLNGESIFQQFYNMENESSAFSTLLRIPKENVKLWWPNGYGEQTLYNLTIAVQNNDEILSSKCVRIGFRTIELTQNQLEHAGREFYFKINNVPIFIKGSNWIPSSILPEKSYDIYKINFLLTSAKDININMLRVWGGGVYESDKFYDLADELGILIWQDFMFSCSMYPANAEFLKLIREEVTQQVLRLSHHVSIALWAANNENEVALAQNWYGTRRNFTVFKNDYIQLYAQSIRSLVKHFDPIRPFLLSSPTNGIETEQEGFVANNPYDLRFGDVHYYNYRNDGWDQNNWPLGRFLSEFGFQSFPSVETFQTETNISSDLQIESKFLESRQHRRFGFAEILYLINQQFAYKRKLNLRSLAYLSQVYQAVGVQKGVEFYKVHRNVLKDNGLGHSMGVMYWQLNDVWAAPSWSSIDVDLKWKMLHYFAKKFYSPISFATYQDNDHLHIYSVMDINKKPIIAALMYLEVFKWDISLPIFKTSYNISWEALKAKKLISIEIPSFLKDFAKCDTNAEIAKLRCFFRISTSLANVSESYVFPVKLNQIIGLKKATIEYEIRECYQYNQFQIILKTNNIALYVWMSAGTFRGRFSDNGFVMIEKTKTVYFRASSSVSLYSFKQVFNVSSLYDYL